MEELHENFFRKLVCPIGYILVWDGPSIPDNWAICDGANGTLDLRDSQLPIDTMGQLGAGIVVTPKSTNFKYNFIMKMREDK